jgi:NAD-dependent dihydropyrimidine dehydrogenase PreA subunit
VIEIVLADRCTGCGVCVSTCPTNVFDLGPGGTPVIARQDDCQTCFMCELYCQADALYVAPDCTQPTAVDVQEIRAANLLGRFRRDSGWDEWAGVYPNEFWRMDEVFRMARSAPEKAATAAPAPPP